MTGPDTNFGWDDEECVPRQPEATDWLLLAAAAGVVGALIALVWWLA